MLSVNNFQMGSKSVSSYLGVPHFPFMMTRIELWRLWDGTPLHCISPGAGLCRWHLSRRWGGRKGTRSKDDLILSYIQSRNPRMEDRTVPQPREMVSRPGMRVKLSNRWLYFLESVPKTNSIWPHLSSRFKLTVSSPFSLRAFAVCQNLIIMAKFSQMTI